MIIEEICPKCGGTIYNTAILTYPPIYRKECPKCGWSEEKTEKIMKISLNEGPIDAFTS